MLLLPADCRWGGEWLGGGADGRETGDAIANAVGGFVVINVGSHLIVAESAAQSDMGPIAAFGGAVAQFFIYRQNLAQVAAADGGDQRASNWAPSGQLP